VFYKDTNKSGYIEIKLNLRTSSPGTMEKIDVRGFLESGLFCMEVVR